MRSCTASLQSLVVETNLVIPIYSGKAKLGEKQMWSVNFMSIVRIVSVKSHERMEDTGDFKSLFMKNNPAKTVVS